MSDAPPRGVVGLLTAQALAFGVTLALLIIPANALFLDAYGSKWLPATYIAIAVFGSGASALIARAARRTRLVRVATASLGALAVLYAASWPILVAGGVGCRRSSSCCSRSRFSWGSCSSADRPAGCSTFGR